MYVYIYIYIILCIYIYIYIYIIDIYIYIYIIIFHYITVYIHVTDVHLHFNLVSNNPWRGAQMVPILLDTFPWRNEKRPAFHLSRRLSAAHAPCFSSF